MDSRKINIIRKIIVVAVVIYGVCPDLFIGPIDDLMVIVLGITAYWALGLALPKTVY